MKLTGVAHDSLEPEHNVCLQSLRSCQTNLNGLKDKKSSYYKEVELMRQFYVRKLALIMEFIGLVETMEGMNES